MTDLTDYAKREALSIQTPDWTPIAGIPVSTREEDRNLFAWGILHLAEELQREDVIEAGIIAWMDCYALGDRKFEMGTAFRAAHAAMLAKIAEG